MNRDIGKLLVAQFMTAMGDNAILFVAVAMVMQGALQGDWYVPALQGCFWWLLWFWHLGWALLPTPMKSLGY